MEGGRPGREGKVREEDESHDTAERIEGKIGRRHMNGKGIGREK